MKNLPGRSAAAAMLFISIFTRLFWGMAADAPAVHAAAWLCPIAGFLLFLPLGLLEAGCGRLAGDLSPWEYLSKRCPAWLIHGLEILFSLLLLADCALNMRMLTGIANVLALNSMPVILLLLPLGVMLAASVLLGTEAAGGNARLWNLLLPPLFLIVFIVHLPSYEARWLTPVLGSGIGEVLRGGLYCGGGIALLSLQWLLSVPDRNRKNPLRYIALAVAAASLQLAALQMLSPSITSTELSRAGRIELVLSNGRTALPLQILLMLIAYGGLLHLIAAEGVACAGFLGRVLPGAPRWCIAAAEGIAATAAAASAFAAPQWSARLFLRCFPTVAIPAVLLAGTAALERRPQKCAKQP